MPTAIKPQILATITLLDSSVGGRRGPILSGEYRGVVTVTAESFSVRMQIPEASRLEPGSTLSVEVEFLFPEIAIPQFKEGTHFTVWEGRVIGSGVVDKVILTT